MRHWGVDRHSLIPVITVNTAVITVNTASIIISII